MPKGKKTLRQIIKGELLTQINEIWRRGKSYHDAQKGDNIQGKLHCEAVEKNLGKLITDDKKTTGLKQIDFFVLSAAACLHDIGKVVADNAKGWKSDHGKRSMQITLEEYDKLGLDRGQAVAVGHVICSHGDGRLDDLPRSPITIGSEELNIIELAAIFRLADMLDTNYQRAPEILSKIKFPDGNVPPKWRGRQSIAGWYLDEKNRLILQAIPKKDEIDASYTLIAMMNEDLAKISPHLQLNGYPFEFGDLDIGDAFLKSDLKKEAKIQRPFPGMAFYTKEDSSIFKGRDREVNKLLSIVNNWPISLLIGESGAGKTSLIHAGLFPKLETILWKFVWTRPFDNPTDNLKKMIWSSFFNGNVDPKKSLLDVMKQAADKCKPHQLLIVVDQFEDVLNCNVEKILNDFSLSLLAVQTGTIIPNLRILLSFREDALVRLNSRLLKKISGSAQQLPSVELERLTRDGAKAALLAGLENAGIGIDPRQEKGQKQLIEIILDDIQKGDDRLYPPYIQIVAEALCKKVGPSSPIIYREIYLNQLKGADEIIARYLMDRLKDFGPQKAKAEKVLIFLTSSLGLKAQKSLIELSRVTDIEVNELKSILNKMIDLRMARAISDVEFEIIHDYLGKIVDEQLVKQEDRTVKFLIEQLDIHYQNYKAHKTPIISPPFMASLYRARRHIKIDEEKCQLFLCTCFVEEYGLGWYWLKGIDAHTLLEMIKNQMSHGLEDIRNEAREAFIELAKPEDKDLIIKMLHDENEDVRWAARGAFERIVKPEDKDLIIKMLHDENKDARRAAWAAFESMVKPEDKDLLIKMLHDENEDVRRNALMVFVRIAKPEDKDLLIKMFHDKEYDVQWAFSNAFWWLGTPEDEDLLIKMLHDENEFIRVALIATVTKIATPEDEDLLVKMLHDENEQVRMIAAGAFESIAKRKNRDLLIKMLHDENEQVRMFASRAFIRIARHKDRDLIIKKLHDKNEDVRRAAAEAFVKIVKPEDKGSLIKLLHERDDIARRGIWKAFEKIAKPEDRDLIIKKLHDRDYSIRWDAKELFPKIATPEDKVLLIKMLGDKDYLVREGARDAFAKIAKPEDKDLLIKMLQDEDENVREAAAKAFEKIAKPEDRDLLIKMLQDENEDVREICAAIIVKIAKPKDKEYLLDLSAEEARGWSKIQITFWNLLQNLDKKFYLPYIKKEWDI